MKCMFEDCKNEGTEPLVSHDENGKEFNHGLICDGQIAISAQPGPETGLLLHREYPHHLKKVLILT